MRTLTSGALAQIAQPLGNEPISIIEVQWTIGGAFVAYADRVVGSIPGKIMELNTLDDVINISGTAQSQEVTVTLDDTDGSLKAIFDSNDIHQRTVKVYQHFAGMAIADKFLLFIGQISSPVSYNEGTRKLTFNIVSQLEDKEIGFSADDGKFDFIADNLIGQPWPMCFGTTIQGKTLKLTEVYKGILAKSFGVPDFALPFRRDALNLVSNFWQNGATAYGSAAEKHRNFSVYYANARAALADTPTNAALRSQFQQLSDAEHQTYLSQRQNSDQFQEQANNYNIGAQSTSAVYNRQVSAVPSTIKVVDGEKFPRGNIQLKIGETVVKGSFISTTNEFTITELIHPKKSTFFASNVPIENGVVSGGGTAIFTANPAPLVGYYVVITSGDAVGRTGTVTSYIPGTLHFTLSGTGTNPISGDTLIVLNQAPTITSTGNGALEIHQLPGARIVSVSIPDTRVIPPPPNPAHPEVPDPTQLSLPLDFFLFDSFPPSLYSQYSLQMFGDNAGYVFNEAGTVVQMYTPEGQQYIVSIVPGTVLNVSAFLTKNGVKKLVTVPTEYYTVENHNYGGGLTAVRLTLLDALSKNTVGGEWGDEIYVTFQSSVGPNTVDVIQYLIETYTDKTVDATSFAAVHTALANYPSHFQILDRKNALQALQEIAFQARCSIYLKNNVFFLRYLPTTPDSVVTFTDSDVDFGTMETSFTTTEEIATKLICKWRATGAQPNDNTAILRYNVKKYGLKEKSFDFYIYNKVDFVLKSATFWLIRYANTWKKIKFRTPLHMLKAESLDGATLNFAKPWIATDPVIGLIETAGYDSSSQQLEFQMWTPVRAGEMVPYDFAYPADIDEELTFPTDADEALQFDGGDGPGRNVGEGESLGIPGNFTTNYQDPDAYKFFQRVFSDRGQPHPSDLHDGSPGNPVVQSTPSLTLHGNIGPSSPPTNNSTPHPQIAVAPVNNAVSPAVSIKFDTQIVDNVTDPDNPKNTTLGDLLLWDEDAQLHGSRLSFFWEGD